MRYISTRDVEAAHTSGFSTAIAQGLAPDGGLFIPQSHPSIRAADFSDAQGLADIALRLLAPFVADDPIAGSLEEICRESFCFPLPVSAITSNDRLSVLELFHGPTAAFKDVGAGFLAACFARIAMKAPRKTILVATSGDTGAAVAAAFHCRDNIDVVVLYPDGQVSPRQAHQLACWGGNVRTYAVDGSFDDCQKLVKSAFVDRELCAQYDLCSANSINIGRLLPQMVYYASAALERYRESQQKPGFVIPSGNLGNAFACLMARRMGLPIGDIVLATNANRPIPDFLETGRWEPRQSVRTLASAMDVGDPSNMERIRWLFPDFDELRQSVTAVSVTDDEIAQAIRQGYEQFGAYWCPHTATAYHAWSKLDETRRNEPWILVATAHAAKFETIVEPLIGVHVPMPGSISSLLDRPASTRLLTADLDALRMALEVK
jgi:threonine synthase